MINRKIPVAALALFALQIPVLGQSGAEIIDKHPQVEYFAKHLSL